MKKLFDPIRKISVEPLPEELVRQRLIRHLLDLGYPQHLIAVEKEIDTFSQNKIKTDRRADILCFTPKKDVLIPILLIECKSEEFSENVLAQVLGYNESIQAPFIAIANAKRTSVYWQEKEGLKSVDFIPSYDELRGALL